MIGEYTFVDKCEVLYTDGCRWVYRTLKNHQYIYESMYGEVPFVSFMDKSEPGEIIQLLQHFHLYDYIMEDFHNLIQNY